MEDSFTPRVVAITAVAERAFIQSGEYARKLLQRKKIHPVSRRAALFVRARESLAANPPTSRRARRLTS